MTTPTHFRDELEQELVAAGADQAHLSRPTRRSGRYVAGGAAAGAVALSAALLVPALQPDTAPAAFALTVGADDVTVELRTPDGVPGLATALNQAGFHAVAMTASPPGECTAPQWPRLPPPTSPSSITAKQKVKDLLFPAPVWRQQLHLTSADADGIFAGSTVILVTETIHDQTQVWMTITDPGFVPECIPATGDRGGLYIDPPTPTDPLSSKPTSATLTDSPAPSN